MSKYGLSPNQGGVITGEDQKGSLAEAGFEMGHMVLAINNQPINRREGFVNLLSLRKPKEKITILALDHRTGNTGTVQGVVRYLGKGNGQVK